MKKVILILAVALGLGSASVFADQYSSEYRRVAYAPSRQDRLEYHINHLQRMLTHVRWELRQYRYRADWRIRREVDDISHDVSRVNWKFRNGNYNSYRLRREVERLHDRLHAVEQRLQVRPRDFYRWG